MSESAIPQLTKLDELNQLKLEMQKLMPLVELLNIKGLPNSLMCIMRDQRLSIMGYSEEEIAEMTKPDPNEKEKFNARLMETQEQELRRLAKLYPCPKKSRRSDPNINFGIEFGPELCDETGSWLPNL